MKRIVFFLFCMFAYSHIAAQPVFNGEDRSFIYIKYEKDNFKTILISNFDENKDKRNKFTYGNSIWVIFEDGDIVGKIPCYINSSHIPLFEDAQYFIVQTYDYLSGKSMFILFNKNTCEFFEYVIDAKYIYSMVPYKNYIIYTTENADKNIRRVDRDTKEFFHYNEYQDFEGFNLYIRNGEVFARDSTQNSIVLHIKENKIDIIDDIQLPRESETLDYADFIVNETLTPELKQKILLFNN